MYGIKFTSEGTTRLFEASQPVVAYPESKEFASILSNLPDSLFCRRTQLMHVESTHDVPTLYGDKECSDVVVEGVFVHQPLDKPRRKSELIAIVHFAQDHPAPYAAPFKVGEEVMLFVYKGGSCFITNSENKTVLACR